MKIHEVITMLQAQDPDAEIRIHTDCVRCPDYYKSFEIVYSETCEYIIDKETKKLIPIRTEFLTFQ